MMQAMIFAAGLGTRLKPLTDRIPKALVRVGGEPLLKRVIFQLKDAGFTRIVVNVHHFSNQIIDYLRDNDNFGMDIRISDESDKLLETGGGIKKAWPLFDQKEPVLIHNVDILSNVDLKKFYQMEAETPLAARLLVSVRKTKRYLLFDDTMRLVGWTNIETGEVKSPYKELDPMQYKMYAFSGIHMVAPSLFPLMEEEPDKFPIMDFYLRHCDKVRIEGYVKNDLKLMDVGKQETLKEAEQFLQNL
nr:nucleotidyltransferase family protein [uncultured Prevotella sp.]